jgi:four helix bundle protein
MKILKFEDLEIWQLALKITKYIYDLTSKKEFSKDFELKNQIRRSVISISSNIVEGFEKNNNNEFIRFLRISKGSCGELRNQIYIALTVEYITQEEFNKANNMLLEISSKIGKFISYLENQRKQSNFIKTR